MHTGDDSHSGARRVLTSGRTDGRTEESPGRAGFPRRLRVLAAATVLVFVALAVSGLAGPADSDQRQLPRVTLTLVPHAASVPVPRSYLGLSTEYWALPLYARHLATFERVLRLIHVPGDGPLILRVGGDSADHAFWDPRLRELPPWAFSLTPEWTGLTAGIVRRLGVRLILDLNLITNTPDTAAMWARAAEAWLPHHSIIGFEIGNEPDIYSRRGWMRVTAGDLMAGAVLPAALTVHDYLGDFRAYGSTLREVAPHLPLIGPAVAEPRAHWRWVRALLASRAPGLSMISVHRYPYSGCVRRRSASFPTIARVLSARASTVLAAELAPMIARTHRAGLPFRLTELNSVTCGGRPGVSDTFATALWAPDTLFALLRARADGVNLHVRANTINAPFAFTPRGLFARPLLYGLMMFSRALAGGVALEPSHLQAAPSLRVHTWVVRTRRGALHILAIDKGARAVGLRLRIAATAPATVQQLRAGSPSARFGVTLGGQHIGPRGQWLGRPQTETVRRSGRGYLVTVPRNGATLITVNPRPAPSAPVTLTGLAPVT
ncbi:MAG: hypothetical protein QOF83_263 [Solirubrobacteraceae bacterium]|jgi:hypothetical protein|nr:hypothetical protein [Solirubrobacteraceae bacterium]